MKNIVILTGNIGSGKSTVTGGFVKEGYICISRDMLRYSIGNGNYIYNKKYEPIIREIELKLLRGFLELGENIIVDEVGISKKMRKRYLDILEDYNYTIISLGLPRVPKKEALKRKKEVPHDTHDLDVWDEVWDKFNNKYEKPTEYEGFNKTYKFPDNINLKELRKNTSSLIKSLRGK